SIGATAVDHGTGYGGWRKACRVAAARLQGPHPVLHRLEGLALLAMILPCEFGHQAGNFGIAALRPECVMRPVALGPRRMILRADDRGECRMGRAGGAGGGFAVIEEGVADPLPPIFGQ